jgi:S-DNA-T family DNA segregation ATPase FtsK/SpoIIIE
MACKPWPAFLPGQFSLQSWLFDAQTNRYCSLNHAVTDWLNGEAEGLWAGVNWERGALRPTAGLVDDPQEARQYPLRFDLTREHLAIFGDSGWGKTSLLRSIIVDLAATHSPDELYIYVLDLGGRNYRSLEALPHLGAVIYADEETFEERLQRLMDRLTAFADQRSQEFAAAGAANLYEYNQRFPDRVLPAVLVVIDNFAPLHENYEMFVEAAVTPLVRRSLALGISFVIATNTPNNVPSRLLALFGEQITFKQSNSDRYLDIVGRGAIEIDDIPGRGYLRVGRRPLLFQAALPVGALTVSDGHDSHPEAEELVRLAANMATVAGTRAWRHPPERIDVLPEIVPLLPMLAAAPPVRPNRIEAVLGQSVNLQPAAFDLKRSGLHFQVVGPPIAGKTTVLYNFVFSLAYRYTPEQVQVVLVDPQRRFAEYGGQHRLGDLPHVVATLNEVRELVALARRLKVEGQLLAERTSAREIFVLIDNYDDIAEEIERQDEVAQELGSLARQYGRDGLHFILAGSMEGGLGEFKRAVQATNYGIGLRTASSLDALRVMRVPAGLRSGRDLAVGRGYAVKSGQPTMLQVASPYDGIEQTAGEEEDRIPRALDYWVEMILARHPKGGPKTGWLVQLETAGPEGGVAAPSPQTEDNPKLRKMLSLLQRAMLWEVQRREEDPEAEPVMPALLAKYDVAAWGDETTLREILKVIHRAQSGLDDEVYDAIYAGQLDDSNLLTGLDNGLPEPAATATADEDEDTRFAEGTEEQAP